MVDYDEFDSSPDLCFRRLDLWFMPFRRQQTNDRENVQERYKVLYNGSLRMAKTSGGVEYWECTGDICVVYPSNYYGPIHSFTSIEGSTQSQKQ